LIALQAYEEFGRSSLQEISGAMEHKTVDFNDMYLHEFASEKNEVRIPEQC
jgi:hypothetical protein